MTDMSTPTQLHSEASPRETLALARQGVKDLLLKSESFRALPLDAQREIARNTVEVVKYMAAPEGMSGPALANALNTSTANDPTPAAAPARALREGGRGGGDNFTAEGAREGAAVAGLLLREVNFPEFVSGLIDGVFHSIVTSSIQQMEAYGRLVADVAKSLNQFRDENVTSNQGRDHLVDQFPDTFMIDVEAGFDGEEGGPRVRLRDGVDEQAALNRVSGLPVEGGSLTSLDLEDEETEQKLVQAARTQLATSRQQLLATMVLMGINRIIVTDGRISAKVMYDFRAKDRFKRSATEFDYVNLGTRTTSEGEYEYEYDYEREGDRRDASYYTSGQYKRTSEPMVKVTSASAEAQDAELSTRASLAGTVEVNFKSETLPLERMADSFQIGQIQNASNRRAPTGRGSGTSTSSSGSASDATSTT